MSYGIINSWMFRINICLLLIDFYSIQNFNKNSQDEKSKMNKKKTK